MAPQGQVMLDSNRFYRGLQPRFQEKETQWMGLLLFGTGLFEDSEYERI